jgi:hypothetical protein
LRLFAKPAKENDLGELSMGMNGDLEMAVGFRETLVSVGTAIFDQSLMRAARTSARRSSLSQVRWICSRAFPEPLLAGSAILGDLR